MKKRNLKSLTLTKNSISNLSDLKGGWITSLNCSDANKTLNYSGCNSCEIHNCVPE